MLAWSVGSEAQGAIPKGFRRVNRGEPGFRRAYALPEMKIPGSSGNCGKILVLFFTKQKTNNLPKGRTFTYLEAGRYDIMSKGRQV